MPNQLIGTILFIFVFYAITSSAYAIQERPKVTYTGVYLMGDKKTESGFKLYLRNKDKLRDALLRVMKQVDNQGTLPFSLMFNSDIEDIKLRINNTLSLALLIVRDDISSESFNTAEVTINKSIINVGLVAILYDTRKSEGKERSTIVFTAPLVGYAQRLDGVQPCGNEEIDTLFVESAVKTVSDHLVKHLSDVEIDDIFGEVIDVGNESVTVNIGAIRGLDEGQNITFLDGNKKAASGSIVKLDKQSAIVELPRNFSAKIGMKVKAINMRASSDETFQVTDVKISSQKAAKYFPQETIGPQTAQWFSNFLTERNGKVVLPSRVGGAWDNRATETAFTILDRAGLEHQFESPKPKHPVQLDITGVSSKIADSNDVNDVCLFKAWIKLTVPTKKYEKEFDIVRSKCLIKGIQKFEEKNELFDLLYQLTAKVAREAEI